ncbi:ABC transporter substrate-binding protein [Azoarcus olearius]|uniref:Extracellular ligand binding protein n=1 Tax=Azoarcus sp. (strain BH72) TaxID=418699 RepID=A1K4C3_AZOSB|nr:ABC transporter substrate-binding protein [Azoarcus olearius]ANQ84226.1 extracellular ligand binding protein [Azoarcus olearius]CAL93678.1 extracellular ligand binding protein [Azoarcus olearius]
MTSLRLPALFRRGLASLLAVAATCGAPAAFAQQGVDADAITLGHTGALSGPLAELNKEYLAGANLYFNQTNERGGINGRRIRLLTLDDAYDPNKAAENAQRLIEQHQVFALFACFGTGPSLKVVPLAAAAKVPFFAPYTGAEALREPLNPYVFHVRASYRQEVEKAVDHLTKLGVKSIGVVHHADPFGQAGLDAAVASLAKRNLTPAVVAPIASSGADAADTVKKVAAANPAAVIMITAGNSSAALLRALQQSGSQPMLYGLSVISSTQLIRELGEKAHGLVIAQVMPSPFRVDYPFVRDYRQAAEKAGIAYSYASLEGYLAARSFGEAVRRAGRDLTREKLISALENMGDWDAGGMRMAFSPRRHVGMDYVDLTVISRGNFTR